MSQPGGRSCRTMWYRRFSGAATTTWKPSFRSEEVPGDGQQVLVVAEVLRRPPARDEQPRVLFRPDVAEGDVGVEVVAGRLLGDVPARRPLVQDHVVQALLRRGDHDLEAVLQI